MDPFISEARWRRECWKGHDSAEGVLRSIRYARRHGLPLRIFAQADTIAGAATYEEVLPAAWDKAFGAEGEA